MKINYNCVGRTIEAVKRNAKINEGTGLHAKVLLRKYSRITYNTIYKLSMNALTCLANEHIHTHTHTLNTRITRLSRSLPSCSVCIIIITYFCPSFVRIFNNEI